MTAFNAKKYDKLYPNRDREIQFLLENLKGKTVLDVGGGTGMLSVALEKTGFKCTNIEPQPEMAKESMIKGIITAIVSIEDFIPTQKYDNVIMVFDVFNFLKDPQKALKNIASILKGRLIFTYWNNEVKKSGWEFNWKLKRLSRKVWTGDKVKIDFWFPFWHETHNLTVYPHSVIREWLYKSGFKVILKEKEKYITKMVCESHT